MNTKNIILSATLILGISICTIAESPLNDCFVTTNPGNGNIELKGKALKEFEKGNRYFEMGPVYFLQALSYYEKAYNINPDNAELNYRMGIIEERLNHKKEAALYYMHANELDSLYKPLTTLSIAQYYHIAGEFEKAILLYEEAMEYSMQNVRPKKEDISQKDRIQLYIRQCENALAQNLQNKVVIILNK